MRAPPDHHTTTQHRYWFRYGTAAAAAVLVFGLLFLLRQTFGDRTFMVVYMPVVVYAAFAGLVWWAMHQPPEAFGRVMKHMPDVAYFLVPFETMWTHARAGHLQTGDVAPDFSLTKLDKSATVQLSDLTAARPVVLVFGSYT